MLSTMYRFISLLLIPFVVLGQGLPHSHTGIGVSKPNGHSLRPHVHLHSLDYAHAHAEHADSNQQASSKDKKSIHGDFVSPVADHDSDAIYLLATTELIRTCPSIVIDFLVADWAAYPSPAVVLEQCRYRTGDPPDKHAGLPFYLLESSLLL